MIFFKLYDTKREKNNKKNEIPSSFSQERLEKMKRCFSTQGSYIRFLPKSIENGFSLWKKTVNTLLILVSDQKCVFVRFYVFLHVFMCFCMFLCVFMCFYTFLCVFMRFCMFLCVFYAFLYVFVCFLCKRSLTELFDR